MSILRIEPHCHNSPGSLVQQPDTGCGKFSVLNEAGEEIAIVSGEAWAKKFAAIDELIAFAKTIASECARCDGKGTVSIHIPGVDTIAAWDADDQSCPDCEDARKLIAKAEGK